MKDKVIIWGAGGHAKVVADIFRLTYVQIIGFVDEVSPDRRGTDFYGSTILTATDAYELLALDKATGVFVAIGNNSARSRISLDLLYKDHYLFTAIHPRSIISDSAKIGRGVVTMANAVVQAEATIGDFSIINTSAIIEHDCEIGSGCHISPGAKLAGNVKIGHNVWVGLGASIRDKTEITSDTIIGMGSVVINNLSEPGTYVGVPAVKKTFATNIA